MIISKCFDIEVFPNLFSVIFVDLRSYLDTFKDCVDHKGNAKALTECLTVKEIRERLDNVKKDIFYVSDTDDSQLLQLVEYVNGMVSHYEHKVNEDGTTQQIPIRYDCYGFNSKAYDDNMLKTFMMYFNRFNTTKELLKYLYQQSQLIIDLQNDKEAFYKDKRLELLKMYCLPYASVDVQQVYGLHSAGIRYDKDTGERMKFGKGLKNTSINLKWHEILDFELPPIDEEEKELYWNKLPANYKRMSLEEMHQLNITQFDRYVLPKYIQPMLHYNCNDVYLVAEMVRQKPDEIKLRYSITNAFGINCLCSARQNISDKLLVKFYSEMSGLNKTAFEKLRTNRTALSFKKIIFPHIHFKTKQLQDLLDEMKDIIIYHTNKDAFCREFEFYNTTYTLATGGLHSQDRPAVLVSDNDYTYVHYDITSFYPSIMISYGIAPKHLNKDVFVKMVDYFKTTRVKCKHTKDEDGYVITGVHNKIAAEALKIVINAIYGKLGSELFWLYDRLAQMQVTINGQLMIMALIESLELNKIHVVSANTDGIIVKLPNDKKEVFDELTAAWCSENKLGADSEYYKTLVTRDINNYFDIQVDDKVEFKGSLDPKQYIKDLKKGYDMPIVAKAVYEFFANKVPVMDTLRNHRDILDFCKTQNVGKQFNVVYSKLVDGEITLQQVQQHVRFYVSRRGVVIMKQHKLERSLSKLASGLPVKLLNTLDDTPIELREIDYSYYASEAYKIINPIRLGISPNDKADSAKGILSGKSLIKKYGSNYRTLFD